jgi:hypothetical protein
MKSSLLIPCLQVSPIDIDQAIGLANLIADFELPTLEYQVGEIPSRVHPGPIKRDFWLCWRRDCDPGKISDIKLLLGQQFSVFDFIPRNHGEGHPYGPNAMWISAMTESSHRVREGWSDHQAILTFEADCVPLRPDWITCLEREWLARQPAQVVGHIHTDHINGNAMFGANVLKDHPEIVSRAYMGSWDYANRELFMKIGRNTDLIFQLYQQPTISEEDFLRIIKNGVRPALLHGIKDLSAQEWARKHLFKLPTLVAQ